MIVWFLMVCGIFFVFFLRRIRKVVQRANQRHNHKVIWNLFCSFVKKKKKKKKKKKTQTQTGARGKKPPTAAAPKKAAEGDAKQKKKLVIN
jgi:hypothetical protein